MPTEEEELSSNKKLINVSNLVQYTKGLKKYLDVSISKKQDVLVNGQNIAKLKINADYFDLIGNSSIIDLTDSIVKTINKNPLEIPISKKFLEIPNNNDATDFTNATINFDTVSNAFITGINKYIGISWKKYDNTLKEYTPVYFYFVGVGKNSRWIYFHFISFDGIYTISTGYDNRITKQSF